MKKVPLIIVSFLISFALGTNFSSLHGNLQIQAAKSLEGVGNVDQVYGRANLWWSYEEDSTFSSIVQVRAYPAGFGYEPLLGGSFREGDTTRYQFNSVTPAIPNQWANNPSNATIQVYQAWIRYRFPDFDIRAGRLMTSDTRSLHFGNYLDFAPGGHLTFSRDGIHNAVEFYKSFGIFHTKVHLGVADAVGDRGFIRFFETITPKEGVKVNLGYKSNVFNIIKYDFNDDANLQLTNIVDASMDYEINPFLNLFLESSWSHIKGNERDPIPVLLAVDVQTSSVFKSVGLPVLVKFMRFEAEYLQNRSKFAGPYAGVDQDILWNVYGEQTWLKRMRFQGGLFAAPTTTDAYNVGIGLRFTSDIN